MDRSTQEYCHVFFGRYSQFASFLTTEDGNVGRCPGTSGTRSPCACISARTRDVLICRCRLMQLQSTTFRLASTNMDSVVNGNVNAHVAKQMKVCKMEELGESVVWREAIGLVAIKTFLEAHGDVFDLEE